jgi:hypothetical protein
MTQDARDLQSLYRALLAAFPDPGALERMLRFGMDVNLAEIASGNLGNQVYAVIKFAEAQGRVDQLLQAALAAVPGNADLRAVADRRAPAAEGPAAAPAAAPLAVADVDKITLRAAIQDAYTLEELQLLCADLQARLLAGGHAVRLSLDDLAGSTKPVKILNLIEFLDRRRLLGVLVDTVRAQRPGAV